MSYEIRIWGFSLAIDSRLACVDFVSIASYIVKSIVSSQTLFPLLKAFDRIRISRCSVRTYQAFASTIKRKRFMFEYQFSLINVTLLSDCLKYKCCFKLCCCCRRRCCCWNANLHQCERTVFRGWEAAHINNAMTATTYTLSLKGDKMELILALDQDYKCGTWAVVIVL